MDRETVDVENADGLVNVLGAVRRTVPDRSAVMETTMPMTETATATPTASTSTASTSASTPVSSEIHVRSVARRMSERTRRRDVGCYALPDVAFDSAQRPQASISRTISQPVPPGSAR